MSLLTRDPTRRPTRARGNPAPAASAPDDEDCRVAGLNRTRDGGPGMARERTAAGFRYRDPRGRLVRERSTLARIAALAIPPAWELVWINPDPDGHLQATGRDARGRKQYRYHPGWRTWRDRAKYGKLTAFARALPAIRRRVARDLGRPGLARERVLATVVRLMEVTHIRVGNDCYARQNGSFGLTTLRDAHARVGADRVAFRFRGKHGIRHDIALDDPDLARLVADCRALPGRELFQYVDDAGRVRDLNSCDVNAYLKAISRRDFTAKDFRTWAGTMHAALALAATPPDARRTVTRRQVVQAVASVAGRLGNTPAVCRACYIHPAVIAAFQDGSLHAAFQASPPKPPVPGLRPDEARVLALLDAAEAARPSPGGSPGG